MRLNGEQRPNKEREWRETRRRETEDEKRRLRK
jgi:hypothetical protein